MSVQALVTLSGVEQAAGTLTALVGTEVRGVQTAPLTVPFGPYAGRSLYQITIGGEAEGETVVFRFDTGVSEVVLVETVAFAADRTHGSVMSPLQLRMRALMVRAMQLVRVLG